VYADGSATEQGGAAATTNQLGSALNFHLGTTNAHIAYEAEIVGLLLALHLLISTAHVCTAATVYIVNQAVIRSTQARSPASAQHSWRKVNKLTQSSSQ
jgi:hypothetical protein